MFNFQKQAEFEAKLVQVYDSLAPETKASISQLDFILEFAIIEINGQAVMPDKPDSNTTFSLSEEDFAQVVAVFKSVYKPLLKGVFAMTSSN